MTYPPSFGTGFSNLSLSLPLPLVLSTFASNVRSLTSRRPTVLVHNVMDRSSLKIVIYLQPECVGDISIRALRYRPLRPVNDALIMVGEISGTSVSLI